MPDHQPEPWQSGAPGPFIWIEPGVEIWALGKDRFRITAPGQELVATGYDRAVEVAQGLADELGRG
jgi:hypothetical protein